METLFIEVIKILLQYEMLIGDQKGQIDKLKTEIQEIKQKLVEVENLAKKISDQKRKNLAKFA
jgi:ATP-dependent helicase/DNAse subunit B